MEPKSWAADAHDVCSRGVWSQKGGQLMLIMLPGAECGAKKAGQLMLMMLAGVGC